MSPRIRSGISVVLGLLVLGGIGYSLFVAVRASITVLASISSSIAVAIIAAAATVLVSVLSIILGKLYESRSLIQKEHREKKIPVYEDLIKFMFRVLMSTKTGDSLPEKEMIEFMLGFTQRAIVWGSDDVLAVWVRWRRLLTDAEAVKANPMKSLFLYEELLFAIRRDLGHRNRALVTGDMLALFVNDVDQNFPRKGS
jgi:hypothetical protein